MLQLCFSAQTLQGQVERQAAELQAAQAGQDQLQQQLGQAQQAHASHASELRKTGAALANALEDQRADSAEQLRRTQEELGGQLAEAKAEAQAAQQQARQLEAELEEARAALEVQHAALQEQLELICSNREAQLVAAHDAQAQKHQLEVSQLQAALAERRAAGEALAERQAALQNFAQEQQEQLAAARVCGWALADGSWRCSGRCGALPWHAQEQDDHWAKPTNCLNQPRAPAVLCCAAACRPTWPAAVPGVSSCRLSWMLQSGGRLCWRQARGPACLSWRACCAG